MKLLIITEKCSPSDVQRDGGARVIETLKRAFNSPLSIMQFGPQKDLSATWSYNYPSNLADRFERRLANGSFIAKKIKEVENLFTHILFIHVSMQFGIIKIPLKKGIHIWTFPMFLTPSYRASGEEISEKYFIAEKLALSYSHDILTPSHLEKCQLIKEYSIPEERIHVVPRGVAVHLLSPAVRSLKGAPIICSIGSIKPQKDTLSLIQLFAKVRNTFPNARLRIIGPIQDEAYGKEMQKKIKQLNLEKAVELTGHIPPDQLSQATQDAHLHLSTSKCETFGRTIFETLASGLPNVAMASNNAAAEYLKDLPYAYFAQDHAQALTAIERMLTNLSTLSAKACEIGTLYDDVVLAQLLVAKLCKKEIMVISDFDGTLFHKNDPEKTARCIKAFRNFPIKVVCSARSITDLHDQLAFYGLEVDWIVGFSGAIIMDGQGNIIRVKSLNAQEVKHLCALIPDAQPIVYQNATIQLTTSSNNLPSLIEWRVETYQGTAFISHWQASKLHAAHYLLRYLNWSGRIQVFGDGQYDKELIAYFDGILITPFLHNYQHKKEIEYV